MPVFVLGGWSRLLFLSVIGVGVCSAAYYCNACNLMVPTRYVFAWSFDGLLPRAMANVHTRYHLPLAGYVFFVVGALAWLAITTVYPGFWAYISYLVASQVLLWIFGCLASALLPYRLKRVYEKSPAGRYKIAGIPVITIAGVLGVISLLSIFTMNLGVPELGATANVPTMVGLAIVGAIIYFTAKWYRSSKEGIDIGLAFKDIPPE
jgi:amino acid transporter